MSSVSDEDSSSYSDSSSDSDSDMYPSLIPGLPNEIGVLCLLRVPVEAHEKCRFICKYWFLLFCNKQRFFNARKAYGMHEPWLFVNSFCKITSEVKWQILDLNYLSWHSIPKMPRLTESDLSGFRCVSVPNEGTVYVCGGMDTSSIFSVSAVFKFEMQENQWVLEEDMITPRCFFPGWSIDGLIYVIGGCNAQQLRNIPESEVYDPKTANWRSLANMKTNIAYDQSVVLDGKILITEGWLWPFDKCPRGHIYDPKTDTWDDMPVGLRQGWIGSCVVVHEHLFVVSEHEEMKLKVYNKASDSWETIEGPSMPKNIRKPYSVTCCDSRIFVVGQGLCVAVGRISKIHQEGSDQEKSRFSVTWDVLSAIPSPRVEALSSHVLYA